MEKQILKDQILKLLKLHYGYDSFRPGQEKVIDNILHGLSTVVIMPTGGGKSLCFQLPALVLEGVTIIISPLIALMKDQVDGLNKIGIPATFINSSISQAETDKRIDQVRTGHFKLLYIAPERFYSQEFCKAISEIKVSLLAIDEAHCISQWGHDFRPSYLKIRQAIELLGNPTVVALTATATPEVKEDIIKQIGLIDPELVITGFARPNLRFGVIKANDAQKAQIINEAINSMPGQAGIIYAGTRAKVDDILAMLIENNVDAVGYHAGLDGEDRKWVQENFMSGKAKVVVATNAFGLGIDKKNIRFVIHYDMPGTIEAYYQEAGRAGRDGQPSACLLLYSPRDRYLQEFFIRGDNPPVEAVLDIYETLLDYETDRVLITYSELQKMVGNDLPEMAIGTAIKILEKEGLLRRAREKSGNAYIKFLAGYEDLSKTISSKAKTQQEILKKLFERFSDELKNGWEGNIEEMASLIKAKKDSILRLVKKLSEDSLVHYEPPFRGTEIEILKRIPRDELAIDFSKLKAKEKAAYSKLDKIEEYIYHFTCRQKYILDYFGDLQADVCGKCDNCVSKDHIIKNQPQPEKLPEIRIRSRKFSPFKKKDKLEDLSVDEPNEKAGLGTKLTQLETYELYQKGLSLDEIAMQRNLKPGTIIEHLCYLIESKMKIDVNKFVDKDKQKKIKEVISELGWGKLAPIKEKLGDEASWDEIRIIIASVKSKNK